jgi:hypothetical protein
MYDQVFQLLARGLTLPPSWAMPTVTPSRFTPSELRKKLFWATDEDGAAQLVRYYHGIICAHPWALLEIEGPLTQYNGSAVFKPQLESPTLEIFRSLVTGYLSLRWRPTPEIKTLTAELVFGASTTLKLGTDTYSAQLQPELNGRQELILPQMLDARLSIATPEFPSSHTLFLRPTDFDLQQTLDDIGVNQTQELADADVLGAYLNAPLNSDKIALALVAMHRIESSYT